jgi:hypothetical protein
VILHGGLLAASIPDYRVTIDSAYHVSLGRAYGEQGFVPWDDINFGLRGRPNLQGPLLHAAIGGLGRILGGGGDDYVLANAILAVVQWLAAMATAAFFAGTLGGELAMLLAVALLSGAAFTSTSFAVGIPSGWLFIFTPWAIWFFLQGRFALASVAASLAIYSHLGGYLTVPVGIAIAALLTRRWQGLLLCGGLVAILTLPYAMHVIRYAGWLSGIKSHASLLFDPLLEVLAIAGAVRLLRKPREHPFMAAWLLAPVAWLLQDPGRFLLQWPLGGSVAAGLLMADWLGRIDDRRQRVRLTAGITVLATVLPFGLPALAGEIAWEAGNHYPCAINWSRARTLVRSVERAGFGHQLIADYSPELCPALAVYAPISCEKGHWVEVQPLVDPADDVRAASKVYILPLGSNDQVVMAMRLRGWIAAHGGDRDTLIVTLVRRPPIGDAAAAASATISAEAQWLGRNAINNALTYADLVRASSAAAMEQFRQELALQRAHAGRVELACIVYAWALERDDPLQARAMRKVGLGLGVIASFIGDDYALDFLSNRRFAELQERFLELATHSTRLAFDPSPSPELMASFDSLLGSVLKARGDMFPGRPPGDWLPWLPG